MSLIIDIDRSIKAKRLIHKGTRWELFWYYFSTYINGLGTIVVLAVFSHIFYNDHPVQTVVFLFALSLFVLVNAYFIDKLYVINSPGKMIDASRLAQGLESRYKKIRIDRTNANVLTARTAGSFWAYDRCFTAIFEQDITAINFSVYGRGEMKYSLIAMANYYRCKAMVNRWV